MAFFNSTGNPAMATGGSGDVLTGMVISLLAQGYNPADAAIIAVFVHGRAGDLALTKLGGSSIIASDIVDMNTLAIVPKRGISTDTLNLWLTNCI
jgi:NAD(P)H-hydrate epimerase